MKYTIPLFVFLCLTAVSGCDYVCKINMADSFVCRCFLFNTSCGYYNYLIEVDERGVLTTFTGSESVYLYDNLSTDMNLSTVRNPFLEEVITQDTVMLSSKELDDLKHSIDHLRNETYTNPIMDSVLYDKWVAVLLVGNKQYVLDITDIGSDKMNPINKLMRLSKKDVRLLPYKEMPKYTLPFSDSIQ